MNSKLDEINYHEFNKKLEDSSFVEGFTISKADFDIFKNVRLFESKLDIQQYPHVLRWYKQIASHKNDNLYSKYFNVPNEKKCFNSKTVPLVYKVKEDNLHQHQLTKAKETDMEDQFEGFSKTQEKSREGNLTGCKNKLDHYDSHEGCVVHRKCISRSSLSFAPDNCDTCQILLTDQQGEFVDKMCSLISAWREVNGQDPKSDMRTRCVQRHYQVPVLSDQDLKNTLKKRVLPQRLIMEEHIGIFSQSKVRRSIECKISVCRNILEVYDSHYKMWDAQEVLLQIVLVLYARQNQKEEGTAVKGELNPWPDFIQERIVLWDKLKKENDEILAAKVYENIKITLPDGAVKEGESWKTTPFHIAQSISQGLAESTIVAKVNGEVWDLDRPFEKDSALELLKFTDDEAKAVFWHSTAHVMGEAMERVYGGHLCYGPPIEEGFYYDMFCDGQSVSNLDFSTLEDVMKRIVKEKQQFERLEIKKEDLLEMFKYNKFKVRILNEKVTTPTTTVYRCGPLIDLCRGPHVRHTGKIKSLAVTKNSSSYWEGNNEAESLQRIYGISFPDPKQLKEWKHFQEEAAKRDHRKLGVQQKLYFFNELSPGSCFFLPHGAYIYNTLIDFIRSEYRKRGFIEVISPNIYNTKLWETSGHWQHYAENMFSFEVEKEKYALKPMNCPGHCVMFGTTRRSWRELPLRFADFGVLHRNEFSGALSGLTRVRRFQQDDAHIFCAPEMIKDEIMSGLDFLSAVYKTFDFEFDLQLSTRPEKYLGEVEMWNRAEEQLEESLNEFGKAWTLNPGDGAFYGPKIDITVTDALRRHHQCATIQLDFQLPIRFDLNYVSETGEKKRPVIIHRAILGSVERMIAILTESYGGKWPFWLSPRQAMVVPVAQPFDDYAKEVRNTLYQAGFEVDFDVDPGDTMNKKIRNAQLEQYNFILVVGEKEKLNGTVNVRTRDNKVHGEHSVSDVALKMKALKENRTIKWEDSF